MPPPTINQSSTRAPFRRFCLLSSGVRGAVALLESRPAGIPFFRGGFSFVAIGPPTEEEGTCISPAATAISNRRSARNTTVRASRRRARLESFGYRRRERRASGPWTDLPASARGPGRAADHHQRARGVVQVLGHPRERGRRSGAGLSSRARVPGSAAGNGESAIRPARGERGRGPRHQSSGALQDERPGIDAVAAWAVDLRRADVEPQRHGSGDGVQPAGRLDARVRAAARRAARAARSGHSTSIPPPRTPPVSSSASSS